MTQTIKEPSIWTIATQLESMRDMITDIYDTLEAHNDIFKEYGEYMVKVNGVLEAHGKKIKEISKICHLKI